jgi:hypothetical protein
MGHAAALIGSKAEGHSAKQALLREGGVVVADGIVHVVESIEQALSA